MANKKLKHFEFANHSEKGKTYDVNTDEVVFFECANGSVFLICQDENGSDDKNNPAILAAQRIKYYLENEFVVNPVNALFNALIYTNGFIYENSRKNENVLGANVHCACVLIRDNKVYYASFGELSVFFFNGKKSFLVAHGANQLVSVNEPSGSDVDGPNPSEKYILLGNSREINPEINTQPLVPLDNDMILMGSKGFYSKITEKNIQKILTDPMPIQTKVYRFVDMANIAGGEENISLQLISFYGLSHTERVFKPIEQRKKAPVKKQKVTTSSASTNNIKEFGEKYLTPTTQKILLVIGILFLVYMFYDLFIHDPMPPVKVNNERKVSDELLPPLVDTLPIQESAPVTPVSQKNIPSDIVYVVKSGDTWSRIYTLYGVCSWFIRSHASNTGKFDSDDNPIAGSRISIPIIYSAKRDLNPDFYQEFSLQKTGSRCENANQAFIDSFRGANL